MKAKEGLRRPETSLAITTQYPSLCVNNPFQCFGGNPLNSIISTKVFG